MSAELNGENFSEGNPMTDKSLSTSPKSLSSSNSSNRPPMPPPRDLRRSLTPPRRDSSPANHVPDSNSTSNRRESKIGFSPPLSPLQRRASINYTTKYQRQSNNEEDGTFFEFDDIEAKKDHPDPTISDNSNNNNRQSNDPSKKLEKTSSKVELLHSTKAKMDRIENATGSGSLAAASSSTTSAGREFKGKRILQYAVWGHYMGYANILLCITLGVFAVLWTNAHTYHCKIDGNLISPNYLPGTCNQLYDGNLICCNPDATNSLTDSGSVSIGVLYILYGALLIFYENPTYGYGLWLPSDGFCYRYRISPIGMLHVIIGIVGLACEATALAGGTLFSNGVVYMFASFRYEAGDGGRVQRKKQAEQAKNAKSNELATTWTDRFKEALEWNPITFYKRIYNEDKLSSYIWLAIYISGNVIAFFVTLNQWLELSSTIRQGLRDGNLHIDCDTPLCKASRKMIRYGPISGFAPWAKAAGMCLNLNGSLILLPVIRNVLRKLNNSGVSFSNARNQTDYFAKFFSHPLTRYIPLQKNIEFHKMCAGAVLFFAYMHMICHYFNLITADAATLQLFRFAKWSGTQFLLGSIVSYSMFIIYTAAPEAVRMAKYEIFFTAHHFYIIFFLIMFLHGPNFIFWSILPVCLYILERYLQLYRGNRPYVIEKVEWIEPVLALYFRPVFKEDFEFKEGQYLYLNCPAISISEWHPFTISSAHDDLHFGPRISLETGEEVVEIPRPSSLSGGKWNKYCPQSKDWRNMNSNEYLDKSDTGYMDYVSCHIKVHGLDEPYARTWTRKFKEYLELLSPGQKFPFYFSRRDVRGDIMIGRQFGPDNRTQIIRVDGPHSAPSEHYTNYGTVMLIGAGIGLTPCASILCALTKYRWKKNFSPEILHFYWIVRQNEVDSFQWLIHMLTELSYEYKRAKEANQIEGRYYCEINIYITGTEKTPKEVKPLYRAKKENANFGHCRPSFTADQLYAAMLNPTIDSKGQIKKMKSGEHSNRLQDIWIWNGRPHWDDIFHEVKEQRQHSDIGVCFCGAPIIGAYSEPNSISNIYDDLYLLIQDLRTMCEKYSSVDDDCLFSLHKENF